MTMEIIPVNEPRALAGLTAKLPYLFMPDEKTTERFFGSFTSNSRNRNTRRAYYKASCGFGDWCEGRALTRLASLKPLHVAGYIEELQGRLSTPSVKRHLAALRMLFDWLVVGQMIEASAWAALFTKKGETPVLDREDARALLACIDTSTLTGRRDRALLGVMVYTFARIGASLKMNVRDYFTQGRRGCVRLNEKGGKEHEAACNYKLEIYMDEYLAASGFADDVDGPPVPNNGPWHRHTLSHGAEGCLQND